MALSRWPQATDTIPVAMPEPESPPSNELQHEHALSAEAVREVAEQIAEVVEKSPWPRIFRTSRLRRGELIFPRQLILDEWHVVTLKRHFPMFWITREESIPYSKIGSITLTKGLLWTTVNIENTGGVEPIVFPGLGNRQAHEVRELIERMTSR